MTDQENNKIKEQNNLIKAILSNNEEVVLKSIQTLREKGGAFVAKPLLQVYFETEYETVRDSVYSLICDLKESKIADILAKNIELYSQSEHLNKLLSAFWQSTLKFSNLDPFINLFKFVDNSGAIEILTIIEQNVHNMSEENRKLCSVVLSDDIHNYNDFKLDIANEILILLK